MIRETNCPLCGDELEECDGKFVCPSDDTHVFVYYDKDLTGYDNHPKWEIGRDVAISYLKQLDEDNEGCDSQDYDNMTNEELGEILCLSGIIHDTCFGKVF